MNDTSLPVLAALTREQIAAALRDYVLARSGITAAGEARIDYAVVDGQLVSAAVYVGKPSAKKPEGSTT